MIGENKSLEVIYKEIMEKKPKSEQVDFKTFKESIEQSLKKGIEISRIAINAFDDGYINALLNLENSPKKEKRIDEFFSICPSARERIIDVSKRNMKGLMKKVNANVKCGEKRLREDDLESKIKKMEEKEF